MRLKSLTSAAIVAAVIVVGPIAGTAALGAGPIPRKAKPSNALENKPATARPMRPAAMTSDDTGDCSKLRKRLWVEGEGWVVRRVSICR